MHFGVFSEMEQGILSGQAIKQAIQCGDIEIDPYNEDRLNPNSYDLCLGKEVRIYKAVVRNIWHDYSLEPLTYTKELDSKKELETVRFEIDPDRGWLLKPGIGYLMHTIERIRTNKYVPILDGKSTLGRLFVSIHQTAGFGDVGFDGQYTLEVTVTHPVRVYSGMKIAQIRFHTIMGEIELYSGKYRDESAKGAVGAKTADL